jgi:CRP-like cAMP-binding protein
MSPGEAFGERALLRDELRSASVTAVTDAEVLALDRADFLTAVSGVEHTEPPPARTAIDALGRQSLLDGVAPASIAALADAACAREIAAGETVVSRGDDEDSWFVVLDGRLVVRLDDRPPRRLLPGDSFGEIAALHERPRTATVVADTRARLVQLSGEKLRAALATAGSPVLAAHLDCADDERSATRPEESQGTARPGEARRDPARSADHRRLRVRREARSRLRRALDLRGLRAHV